MSVICSCPLPTALTAVGTFDCPEKLDQVVRLAFQRKQATPTFDGTAGNDITVEADWNTRIAAVDNTKIVLSPFISGLTFPNSESIVNGGGDNTTVFGLPEYQGEGNITVEATLKDAPANIVDALDLLSCESKAQAGKAGLTAFFFNRFSQIMHGANFDAFEIYNFRLSSMGSEGYNASNVHMIRFDLVNSPDCWDRGKTLVTPAFDPLTL